MTTQNSQAQIEGLATLLVLGDELRKVRNLREFGFFSTNETHRLIPYHTAFLWQRNEHIGVTVLAQSGTPELDDHAPVIESLKILINTILSSDKATQIHQIDLKDEHTNPTDILLTVLNESLPPNLLWCPFLSKSKRITGGIILFRENSFSPAEIKMLQWLIESYQYTWGHLNKKTLFPSLEEFKQKPYLIGAIILVIGILLMPVRLSVLGTGTVAPKDPAYINAPIEGVIKAFTVSPGTYVKPNQVLFTMDRADLQANAEVLNKEYSLTQAKLRTAINEVYDRKEAQSEIPILQAQLAIDKAKIDDINKKLHKTNVITPIGGVVIFDSKEDWIGQPVETGEKILLVADPHHVNLKIMLPVANAIELPKNAEGVFFLHGQLKAIPIQLTALGYNAKLTPNKILAYKLSAEFKNLEVIPQLGAQGTVRLYGYRVPFIYYLLRRPLQSARQLLGL